MNGTATKQARLSIGDKLEQLGALSRSELVDIWIKQFMCDPPKGVKHGL